MARRKRQDGGFLAMLYYGVVAIGTLLLTAVVYTPVLLLMALGIYWAIVRVVHGARQWEDLL